MGTEECAGRGFVVVGRGYWNIKECGDVCPDLGLKSNCFTSLVGGGILAICGTNVPPGRRGGNLMKNIESSGICCSRAGNFATACALPPVSEAFAPNRPLSSPRVSTNFGRAITRKRRSSLRPASRPPSQIWRRRYSHSSLWPIPSSL